MAICTYGVTISRKVIRGNVASLLPFLYSHAYFCHMVAEARSPIHMRTRPYEVHGSNRLNLQETNSKGARPNLRFRQITLSRGTICSTTHVRWEERKRGDTRALDHFPPFVFWSCADILEPQQSTSLVSHGGRQRKSRWHMTDVRCRYAMLRSVEPAENKNQSKYATYLGGRMGVYGRRRKATSV